MGPARLRAFFRYLRPYRANVTGLFALTAFLSVLAMLPPLLSRALIDEVITRGRHALFPPLAVFMIAVPVLNALFVYLQVLGIAYVGQKFVMDIRSGLFRHLLGLSLRFFGRHSVGKLVNRLMDDSATLQNVVTVSSVQVLSDLICAAFALTATFALNWPLAVLLLTVVAVFVFNYKLSANRMRQASRRYRGAQDRLAGGIQNRLVADLTVKTYGGEAREQDIFRMQSDQTLDLIREAQYAVNTFSMNTLLLQRLGHALIYFIGCAMVLRDSASFGDVVAFTAYAGQLLWPAVRFSYLAQQIQEAGVSADRMQELLAERPEIANVPGAARIRRLRGNVDFDHVTFWYDKGRPVLRNLDFHVQAGTTVALVGETGSGKTTILSLLLRFFEAQKGAVRIDGMDVRDIDLALLRRQFGIVLQESLLFNISIADNIRYSRPKATREEIETAARVAEIHAFIAGLPQGYDTLMGERGIQMSIGQKQRVNIARAVLADPAVIIMDEATSALDSESERAIQIAMGRFLKGRTSFIVAHRLSTVRNADVIVLLDRGRIVEMGRHDELVRAAHGRYRDLYEKHSGKGVISDT